jgi:rubrerythrin
MTDPPTRYTATHDEMRVYASEHGERTHSRMLAYVDAAEAKDARIAELEREVANAFERGRQFGLAEGGLFDCAKCGAKAVGEIDPNRCCICGAVNVT